MSARDAVDRRGSLDGSAVDRVLEGGPASRDSLSGRLDSLPEGHPSSAFGEDGSRRQPTVSLRDLEIGPDEAPPDRPRPLTDAEWSDHLADVRDRLTEAQRLGLSTTRLYRIDPNGQSWTEERRTAQDSIINDIYDDARDVPNQYKAVVAGGLAGSGKTTTLDRHPDIDRSQYLTINPDDIKVEMAKRGMVPEVEGLSPMEASDLVHEESSYVARQLALRACADGKNVIWDITMSDTAKTKNRIDELRDSGYQKVDGIFVDIPAEVSATRANSRHREGEELYRQGQGLGGRYVPSEIITAQVDEQWGSKNRRTFEELKPHFDQWTRFDNGVDGRDPVRAEASSHGSNREEVSA